MVKYLGCPTADTKAKTESLEKTLKKDEKTFKKGIDKREGLWYNRKVDARAAAEKMIFEN